jgi:GNAT superfamily N-acetyltransferase
MMRDEFLDGDVVGDRLAVWRERLGSPAPNQLVVVAEEDSEIRGFICAFGDDDAEWGSLVDNLHVNLECQKQGIGALLLREGAAWAAANYPGRGLYLWVMQANDNAQRFYEHLGGANVGAEVRGSAERGPAHVFRYAWPDAGTIKVR